MTGSHPPFTALAITASENRATSSAIGLNVGTTVVEVTTVGAPVAVKWGASVIGVAIAAGSANFDTVVPANTSRLLVVPRSTAGLGYSSVSSGGMRTNEGLFSHMALISGIAASVYTAEY